MTFRALDLSVPLRIVFSVLVVQTLKVEKKRKKFIRKNQLLPPKKFDEKNLRCIRKLSLIRKNVDRKVCVSVWVCVCVCVGVRVRVWV